MDAIMRSGTTNGRLDKPDIRNRLRSAQGHIRAIAEMIDGDADCIDILRQVSAVRGAIRAINRELCRAYLVDEQCRLRSDVEEQRVKAWQELETLVVGYQEQ
jgi:DNA-binding FrmR family transcriptional regulator